MNIISKFKQFFSIGEVEEKRGAAAAAAAADILLYVVGLAMIPAKVQKQQDEIEKLKNLPSDEQTALFGDIYSEMERYLIEESGKKLMTEDIKNKIREKFDLEKTDEKIRVFFLPEAERVFTFYNIVLDFPFKYLTDNLGANRLNDIVAKGVKDTVLEGTGFDGRRFHFEFLMRKKASTEDIAFAFSKLNNFLYQEISSSFGKNKADALVDQMRGFVKKTYAAAAAAAAAADFPTYLTEISRGLGEEKKEEKAIIPITSQAREMIVSAGMGELVTKGFITGIETELVSKDGKAQPVTVSASALKDEAGNIQGMVIAAKDMSEVQRLQRENLEILEKAKEEAEALVATRTKELQDTVDRLTASEQQQKAANQQLGAANQQLGAAQKNLQDKLLELERFNKVAVGRELKMVELKEEISRLKDGKIEAEKRG